MVARVFAWAACGDWAARSILRFGEGKAAVAAHMAAKAPTHVQRRRVVVFTFIASPSECAKHIPGYVARPGSQGRGRAYNDRLSRPAPTVLCRTLKRAGDDGADQADEDGGEDRGEQAVDFEASQERRHQPEAEGGN